MDSEVKITDLLSILDRQIANEPDRDLANRRRGEVNNILQILKLDPDAKTILECRDRLKRLVSFPKEAGLHSIEEDDSNELKRFYDPDRD